MYFFEGLLTVHLSIFISVINQLDAQNFCFIIRFFYDSTCFEHYVLIIRRSILYYTASGIFTLKQVSGLKLPRYNSTICYYLLIFIELYFSNFIPLICFSVMIPEAV